MTAFTAGDAWAAVDRLDAERTAAAYAARDADEALAWALALAWPSQEWWRARVAGLRRRVERTRIGEREAQARYATALAVAERLSEAKPGWLPEFPPVEEWQDAQTAEIEDRWEREAEALR